MVKLSSNHAKKSERDDVVHRKAAALHVTPEEVFARAYLDAGFSRSESNTPFSRYCKEDGSKYIPEVVLKFCEKPLPTCANRECPTPQKSAHFTRTDEAGRPTYFCSLDCMKATPKVDFRSEQEITSAEGIAILERVRVAMSNAAYVKVPPEQLRPLKGQPRVYFNPERQAKLVRSLKSVGQMMPGIIRSVPKDEAGTIFEILDGERRQRGVLVAGLPEYRAMQIEIDDEAAPYVVSVIANFNREEHTLLELADSVQKLHEKLKLTMYQIGEVLGIPAVEASKMYGLRRLVPEVRDMLDPHMVKGHPLPKLAAIEISLQPPEKQLKLAEQIMNREFTVAGLKEHIRSEGGAGGYAEKRQMGPEQRRAAARSRLRMVANSASGLLALLREPGTAEALQLFPGPYLEQQVNAIKIACEQLLDARKLLEGVLKAQAQPSVSQNSKQAAVVAD